MDLATLEARLDAAHHASPAAAEPRYHSKKWAEKLGVSFTEVAQDSQLIRDIAYIACKRDEPVSRRAVAGGILSRVFTREGIENQDAARIRAVAIMMRNHIHPDLHRVGTRMMQRIDAHLA